MANLNWTKLAVLAAIAIGVMFAVEAALQPGAGGSLIIALTFWTMVPMGCVAVMAGPTIVEAEWHLPIMKPMLSAHAMIPVMAVAFLLMFTQLEIYPWLEDPGVWLNKNSFLIRHFAFLMICFFLARKFATEALKRTRAARRWAVLYIFAFAFELSMVGFEWIMSIEKPWFSTLFGAWFFVQAFQCGLIVAIFVLFGMRKNGDTWWHHTQKSAATMMFGFTVVWAYFYFSQLIVIWYGNLPSEVEYVIARMGSHTPYFWLSRAIFAMCWVIPFFVLLGKKAKYTSALTVAMGTTIMLGFTMQFWLMVFPAGVPVSLPALGIHYVAMAVILALVIRNCEAFLPNVGPVAESAGDLSAAAHH